MRKPNALWGGLAGLAAALLLASPASADEAHSLKVRLDWLPSGYQTPIFLAAGKGWFKAAGLDVSIADGNGSATTVQLVGAGQFDVGHAALSNMAFARGKGIPVVAIAGLFRKGDTALLVPLDSPIRSPADLKGRTVVSTPGSLETPFLDPFLAAGHLTRGDVHILYVDASAKVSTYLSGKVDGVFTSTAFTLPLVMAQRPTRPVLFADFGLNLPGFGLFTTTAAMQRKGDALRKFASIVAGSWTYVLKGHEEEAVQAALKARPQAGLSAALVMGQLKASLPFLYTAASETLPIGEQTDADWAAAIKVMEEAKAIEPGSRPGDYYTNAYLDPELIRRIGGG